MKYNKITDKVYNVHDMLFMRDAMIKTSGVLIRDIKSVRISRSQSESKAFEVDSDIRDPSKVKARANEIVLKGNPLICLERFSGVKSCETLSEKVRLRTDVEGSLVFTTTSGPISIYIDNRFSGSTDIFFLEGKADIILIHA